MTTSELQKLLESLHPLEHKVLLSFDREGALSAPDILTKSGLDESRLDMASGWLQTKGLLDVKDESVTTQVSLTETGKEYREKGTPEMRIMNALKEGRQFTVKDIIQTWGMDPSEVSSTVGSLKQASLVQIAQGGVLALTATGSVYSSYDDYELIKEVFSREPAELMTFHPDQQAMLQANFHKRGKSKGIFRITEKKNRSVHAHQ